MKAYLCIIGFLLVTGMLLETGGCTYFNTYYNLDKKFREAERETNRQQANQPAGQPSGNPGGQPGQPGTPPRQQSSGVAIDKYRKVIETAAKLLEYYPKSRWVDDTLLLMGISYYRLQDYSRAERKFTELITLFPQSKHVSQAGLWKARTLVALGRPNDAIELLNKLSLELKGRRDRGEAEALLANTEFDRQRWDDAAPHFEKATELLPAGEPRNDALYRYGICELNRKAYPEALKVFVEVARGTPDPKRAFDANIFASRAALAAGDAEQAEQILKRLKQSADFEDLASDVDLELANLAVQTGRIDEGIAAYQTYLEDNPQGDKRGVAFYRLANVFRVHRIDLPHAKEMLDSAIYAGGSNREISDSARIARDEISKGLQVLVYYQSLQDSVMHLEARRDSLEQKLGEAPLPSVSLPTVPVSTDTTARSMPAQTDSVAGSDSTAKPADLVPLPDDSSSATLQAADSTRLDTARSVAPADSTKIDTTGMKRREAPPHGGGRAALDSVEHRLTVVRSACQLAALHVAEFYDLSTDELDSALAYYRIAAGQHFNWDACWKANLYLATYAAADTARSGEAKSYYQVIVAADSVPPAVMREARLALGMAVPDTGKTPQQLALLSAEQVALSNQVSPDSAVKLYGTVVGYDSNTVEARTALFAQLHLYESEIRIVDSAEAVAHRIIDLFPDSSFTDKLRLRVLPPDSGSIFLKTDEQLYPARLEHGSVFEETPTDGGWPPPEESLRGRRFE